MSPIRRACHANGRAGDQDMPLQACALKTRTTGSPFDDGGQTVEFRAEPLSKDVRRPSDLIPAPGRSGNAPSIRRGGPRLLHEGTVGHDRAVYGDDAVDP